MPALSRADSERTEPPAPSGRCYSCFRKAGDGCFCDVIPRIQNQIEVLILQHVRERFHPFNTARIVRRALARSRLLVTAPQQRETLSYLKPRAGLLYPGRGSRLLSELPADEFPEQLVILDGTWHQAKTLVRDNPALWALPQYRLAPSSPSRSPIRREPTATALSTVEATIAALRVLEPETRGFDQLMAAFETMVDRQVAHPKSQTGWRSHRRRRATSRNIPAALLGDLSQVVVCYGESSPGQSASGQPGPAQPLSWVAQRLGTGEKFAALIRPGFPLEEVLLGHLEMTRQDFERAVPLEEARAAWSAFLRPDDVLAVYNQGVVRLLEQLGPSRPECLVLKSVQLRAGPRCQTLDEQLQAESITPDAPPHPGRAGKRLANLIAWVRYLRAWSDSDAIPTDASDSMDPD